MDFDTFSFALSLIALALSVVSCIFQVRAWRIDEARRRADDTLSVRTKAWDASGCGLAQPRTAEEFNASAEVYRSALATVDHDRIPS
jgi:hypothetical protein